MSMLQSEEYKSSSLLGEGKWLGITSHLDTRVKGVPTWLSTTLDPKPHSPFTALQALTLSTRNQGTQISEMDAQTGWPWMWHPPGPIPKPRSPQSLPHSHCGVTPGVARSPAKSPTSRQDTHTLLSWTRAGVRGRNGGPGASQNPVDRTRPPLCLSFFWFPMKKRRNGV